MPVNIPSFEHRRVKITTNVSVSPRNTDPQRIAASHPFTQQESPFPMLPLIVDIEIDVIFPSSKVLESALSKLETRYYRGKAKLSEIVEYAVPLASSKIPFIALSINEHEDDVWCIDPRGLLTLSLSKDTYEKVGLLGKKLPFKNQSDKHVVRLPLQQEAESVNNRIKRNEALRAWDTRREEEGLGLWDVLFCLHDATSTAPMPQFTISREVKCQIIKLSKVCIPTPSITSYPSTSSDDGALEDWNINMSALFEWMGMACLGSQRLLTNDRVDPYVSVYECPTPSYVGDITHLRWRGFLGSEFVQSVIDTGLANVKALLSADTATTGTKPFIAITSHAFPVSPVSYIPPSTLMGTLESPMRLPRRDGEDTWCLFVVPEVGDSQPLGSWAFVESLGQYDARWG